MTQDVRIVRFKEDRPLWRVTATGQTSYHAYISEPVTLESAIDLAVEQAT
jgi:hypothetical protein